MSAVIVVHIAAMPLETEQRCLRCLATINDWSDGRSRMIFPPGSLIATIDGGMVGWSEQYYEELVRMKLDHRRCEADQDNDGN